MIKIGDLVRYRNNDCRVGLVMSSLLRDTYRHYQKAEVLVILWNDGRTTDEFVEELVLCLKEGTE